ncbi:MAG TPA: DUF4214 domain-containing protein [Pirellulales bacterium]|nr:DUF4214 domain-containing protein [Pirellulales bacterium]
MQPLESRLMLDAGAANLPPTIVVGRTLSAYDVPDVQNHQETITLTVYNQAADPISGVLLTDTLMSGVTFAGASQLPDQDGQHLAWSLGTIQPYDNASVTLTVSLADPIPTQLDTGASVYGTLDAGMVTWTTAPATLRTTAIAADLLASTPDANTTDPYIQEEAAQLNYDPTQIYNFLQTQIGYNSYSGSLRGARGALWSDAANSLDDASLGIALLRASGIPAQYEEGTLSQSQAQQLILSMFPASYQTVGYVPAGTQTSDPANDPQLLSETEDHFWFQFDAGAGMTNADPEFAGQSVGQAATASTKNFTEVPDSLRAKTEIQLTAETYSQAAAAFAPGTGSALTDTVVLDQTFNDVDLVGHPLTVGNFVTSQTTSGATVSATTRTYSPYVLLDGGGNGQGVIYNGTDYQEVITNFALSNQVLTGLFLQINLTGPGEATQTLDKTLYDAIGIAQRDSGAPVSVNAQSSAPLNDLDVFTFGVFTSPVPQSELATTAASITSLNQQLQAALPGTSASDETTQTAALDQVDSLDRQIAILSTAELAEDVAFTSDQIRANLTAGTGVAVYSDSPRVIAASQLFNAGSGSPPGSSFEIDVLRNTYRIVAPPSQAADTSTILGVAIGIDDKVAEDIVGSEMESELGGVDQITSMSSLSIFSAAVQQGIPLVTIDQANLSTLSTLNISAEAKAQITQDVQKGETAIVPSTMVTVGAGKTIAWIELNTASGDATIVSEDGSHGIVGDALLRAWNAISAGTLRVTAGVNQAAAVGLVVARFQAAIITLNTGVAFCYSFSRAVLIVQKAILAAEAEGVDPVFVNKVYMAFNALANKALHDPPVGEVLFSPLLGGASNDAEAAVDATSQVAAGEVQGPLKVASAVASGSVTASWTSVTPSSFIASSLDANTATVLNQGGTSVGTGKVVLSGQANTALSISGNTQYSVSGAGNLSFYAPAESNLGVSANWNNYSATVTGNVSVTLTVPAGALTLNGQALPAGTYTVTTNSTTLSGSGNTTSPNFSGSASVSITNGTVTLGSGSGSATVGGNALDVTRGATLTGYTGSVTVAAGGGNNLDNVTLAGNTANVLTVSTAPDTLTTNQNTPVTFQASINTSFADAYNLTVNAPPDWTVTLDTAGKVTVTPAPGTQGGTYPIQVIAQSTTNPALVSQATVEVTVTPTVPGMTFNVASDAFYTVPYDGAQLPTAFRATIQNTGPSADTYDLTFSGVPAGFTVLNSGTAVTVPAGRTGIVGLYLQPNGGALPPPGTNLSFSVTSTSTSDPSITQTVNVSFTMPTVVAATITATPTQVATTPGTATTAQVTITNVGNVAYDPALATTTDSGLTISGLTTPGVVPIGQSVTETVTLSPDASTPLNSVLNATVSVAPAPAQNMVSVLSVSATAAAAQTTLSGTPPPEGFVVAGQSVNVSSDVQSAVAQTEQGTVLFTVTNGQGDTVFTSTPAPITLSTIGSVTTVDLGNFSTSGFAAGEYTVHVTVDDSTGTPIAGATGLGDFFVNLPITASLAITSDNQTPGPVASQETLTVTSHALLGGVQTDSAGESVAVSGNLAYVAGSQDISVLDISNPGSPQVLSTFGSTDINQGGLNLAQVTGDNLLVASQDPTNTAGFTLLIYSLADPQTPTLTSSTTIPYAMLTGLTVQGTTAFLSTSALQYDANGTVTGQFGDLVTVDFGNPAAPAISGTLFDDLSQPHGHAASFGQAVAINNQLAYVASSTSTGGDTQDGNGELLIVNSPSGATGATLAGQLTIPNTVQAAAIAIDGTHALVVGSTGGWNSPFGSTSNIGLSGNVTLTVLDISNPASPTIIGSTVVTQNTFAAIGGSPTGTIQAIDLGNGRFAISGTLSGGTPTILCVDASDPINLATSNLSLNFNANGMAATNGELLTAGNDGLDVYQAAALATTAVTVTVTVPTNGVSVVPGSFSITPTSMATGANTDTLTWNLNLAPGVSQQITWQTNISDLQADQVQPMVTGTSVQFATGTTSQTLSLPELDVAGVATPATAAITVEVAVPGAVAISNASTAATALGMTDLATQLGNLSTALTNLVETPSNANYKSQALAALASILSLMANDPNLEQFVAPLTAARNQLAAANTPADIQAAIVNLGGVLTNFGELVTELEQSNVHVTLIPSSVVAQPGVPQSFDVRLQNVGTQTTTYDLSVSGLPGSVTSQFSSSSITLNAGQTEDVTLTLTQSGELVATSFQVAVSAQGVSIPLIRSATGTLEARAQFVSVSNIGVNPPFGDAGTQVAVTAQLLNAVNEAQSGSASYTVTNPGGTVVFTSASVPVSLGVQTSLITVDLPALDTTGFAPGQYTIRVTVLAANGNALPGATATATFLVGSPVTATSTVSPQTVPTGDSTVNNTLTIDSHAPLGNSFNLVGQLPISSTTSTNTLGGDTVDGVAIDGNVAYVFGDQGVHVVDISDPTNPQELTTQTDFPQTNGTVVGNQLIAINAGEQSGIAVDENSSLTDYDLSGLGTPQAPFRTQTLFPNYTFANSLIVSPDGTHAYVSYEQETYDTASDTITAQNGTLISFNISNPANLTSNSPNSILFNTNGSNDTAPLFQNGGNNNLFEMAQPNANTLLVGASSSTGTDTQSGVGEILVVNVSDPDNINSDPPNTNQVVDTLQIPGTVQVHGIAIEGNTAFVVASQGGWLSPFTTVDDIGPTGNLVLATVDISNPDDPQLIHEQTLNRSARGGGGDLISLGNHLFAFSSLGESTDTPEIIVVDATDPNNLQVVDQIQVPGDVRGLATNGQYLLATGDSGLLIYSIAGVGSIPVTAQVQVPNGTGVSVVPGSFNVTPTQIITGSQFDTLEWDFTLDPNDPNQTLTWQTALSGMQPGESRAVTTGTTVGFDVQSTPGQISLPAQNVVADQILELDPAQQTTQPGQTAQYTVTVLNPTSSAVTYDLGVQGLPQGWAQIAATVTVPAGGQDTVPLSITSDPFAPLGSDGFAVTATAGGTAGSVLGTLVLAGQPVLPPSQPDARGVVATITPAQATAGQSNPAVYTITLTNTGSVADTYSLSGLFPTGFTGTFSQTSVMVPPGVSNFRDVKLTLTPPAGAAAQSYPFTVTATSTSDATVQGQVSGTASVVAQGVQVSLTPGSGAPGGTFELKVTNTGSATDTFNLALASPGGLVSTLGTNTVTLAAGASQSVPITTNAANFADPGDLSLTGIATSQTNGAVQDQATASLAIASTQSVTAAFTPTQQTLTQPGATSFSLQVKNTGNTEDSYSATIVGTTGGVTASLVGLDGQPTQSVPLFILPGLTSGAITLEVTATGSGQGSVTVLIQSLTNSSEHVTATAQLTVATATGEGGIVATGATFQGYEFSPPTGVTVATFTDGNGALPAADFSATIDWGDGTSSAGTVSLSSGTYTVTGAHEYSDEGHYSVGVSIAQTAGTLTSGATSATVGTVATIHEQLLENGNVGTPDQNWVQEMYRDLFDRQAESQGLDFWVGLLDAGQTRGQVAFDIVQLAFSEEFQRDTVTALYEQYLDRAPDPGGAAYWTMYLYNGGTIESMAQALVSSPEYWQTRGGGTNAGFLETLFNDALGRAIDPAALTYYEGLMAGGATPGDIASIIFNSDEYHRVRVNDLFEQFLDRPADVDGLAFFAGELDDGITDELVITQLTSSDEYFDNVQV